MKNIAVVNQKGGQAKTTVSTNLAYAARESGLRVLLVDLDPQGSASLIVQPTEGASPGLTASALFTDAPNGLMPEVVSPGFSIIRADKGLQLLTGDDPAQLKMPRKHLKALGSHFDVCIIDTPGSIALTPPMTAGALVAAETAICPFSIGLVEIASTMEFLSFFRRIKEEGYNPTLGFLGLLPSKINTKSRNEMDALAGLREELGDQILPVTLAERASVKQAFMNRKPVWVGTKGAGHRVAGKEWKAAMNMILTKMGALQ
jgi:chromosome partitioning protein